MTCCKECLGLGNLSLSNPSTAQPLSRSPNLHPRDSQFRLVPRRPPHLVPHNHDPRESHKSDQSRVNIGKLFLLKVRRSWRPPSHLKFSLALGLLGILFHPYSIIPCLLRFYRCFFIVLLFGVFARDSPRADARGINKTYSRPRRLG